MKNTLIKVMLLLVGLTACTSPKMNSDEINKLVFGTNKGVFADAEIGDTWEQVKNTNKAGWELDEASHKLMKTYDDFNNVILVFGVDEKNNVRSLSLSISGKKGNHLLITEMKTAIEKKFNNQYTLASEGEGWSFKAPNGDECGANISLTDDADRGSKTLNVTVYNSTAML